VNLILSPELDRDALVERILATLAERRRDLDEGRFPLEKFEVLKVRYNFNSLFID